MTLPAGYAINPELDLVLEREVDVPPHLVWAAWTDPKHIVHWFTPAPWRRRWPRSTCTPAASSAR